MNSPSYKNSMMVEHAPIDHRHFSALFMASPGEGGTDEGALDSLTPSQLRKLANSHNKPWLALDALMEQHKRTHHAEAFSELVG